MKTIRRNKRPFAATLVGVICLAMLATLAGCDDAMYESPHTSIDRNDSGMMNYFDNAPGSDWDFHPDAIETTSIRGNGEVAGVSAAEHTRKVIRNAHLWVETKNEEQSATDLYALLLERCNTLGGHEFSSEMRHHERFSSISAVLKIPPEKLDEFLTFVGESAKINNSRVESDDVTDEYYDLQTRLETKRKSLDSYYALLENARGLEEIISLQRTIDAITEEIESVEGRLRVLNSLVDMATVTLEIRHVSDPEKERHEVDWSALSAGDMGYLIRAGFVTVVSVITQLLQWLLIIVAVTSPLWIPLAIVIFVLVKRSKAKRKQFNLQKELEIEKDKREVLIDSEKTDEGNNEKSNEN